MAADDFIPPVGTVQLTPVDSDIPGLWAALVENATPSGGIGGWEAVPRPGRRPLTVWRGPSDPLRLSLPLLFDRYTSRGSVEPECRRVLILGGYDPVTSKPGTEEPPKLRVQGAVPFSRPQNQWVIEGVEWGEALWRQGNAYSYRVRQYVTVTLALWTQDARLAGIPATAKAPARYSSKPGDTFESIAKAKCGGKKFGGKLARLNGKPSGAARKKLKTGTKIRLPDAKTLADWKRG